MPRRWREKRLRQRTIAGLETTTMITIPNTRGGELLDLMIKKEAHLSKLTGFYAKIVEGNGTPLGKMFEVPGRMKNCASGCEVCKYSTSRNSKCKTRNVLYTAVCRETQHETEEEVCGDLLYIGESSRSLSERADEHVKG